MKRKNIGGAAALTAIMCLAAYVAAGLLILACLAGCTRTVYEPVERVTTRTDTVYSAKFRVDSVILRDSVTLMQRGDTVFVAKYTDRYRVKERVDTVYQYATDSVKVRIPYPVKRELTKWEAVKMDAGGVALGAVMIAVCVAVIWLIKKFRK